MRFLAIDFGGKNVGLAICDAEETIVSPLIVLDATNDLINEIIDVINNQQAQGIVVGLPINMDDTEGPQAECVRDFVKKMQKHTSLPIYFQDERLSSFEAECKLAPAELTRKKKKKRLDAVAAAEILQTYIDSKGF